MMLMVAAGIFLIFVLPIWFVYSSFVLWEQNFAKQRVTRKQKTSPSNKDAPDLIGWGKSEKCILNAVSKHHSKNSSDDSDELLNRIQMAKINEADSTTKTEENNNNEKTATSRSRKIANSIIQERSQRTNTFRKFSKLPNNYIGSLDSKIKAEKLDMDHVYVPFLDFLWAQLFIGPNSMFLWMKGIIGLMIRKKLLEWNYIKPMPFNPKKVVGKLCLEGN